MINAIAKKEPQNLSQMTFKLPQIQIITALCHIWCRLLTSFALNDYWINLFGSGNFNTSIPSHVTGLCNQNYINGSEMNKTVVQIHMCYFIFIANNYLSFPVHRNQRTCLRTNFQCWRNWGLDTWCLSSVRHESWIETCSIESVVYVYWCAGVKKVWMWEMWQDVQMETRTP